MATTKRKAKRTTLQTLRTARVKSVPIVAVGTPDQQAFARAVLGLNGGGIKLAWDCATGVTVLGGEKANPDAAEWLTANPLPDGTDVLSITLGWARRSLPIDGVLVLMNAHLFLSGEGAREVVQAISNIRDPFKADGRTLVLLGPSFKIGPELKHDVVVLQEELPDDEALGALLDSIYTAAGEGAGAALPPLSDEARRRALDAVRGLSLFEAEQVFALSVGRDGLDLDAAWDRKREFIKGTSGLQIARGGLTLDELVGWTALKELGRDLRRGPKPPRVIVYWDEVEKAMAGSGGGDTTGISSDIKGQVLTTMEELEWDGVLLLGPAGVGKSAYARALGADIGCETVMLDVGGTKSSLYGSTETAFRACLATIEAMGAGSVFVIGTCNDLSMIDAPLRRRFTAGIYFCDTLTEEERGEAWKVHAGRYGLDLSKVGPVPKSDGWTGAEIRNACKLAWQLGTTLSKAADRIVPVVKSDPRGLAALREAAHLRFLDASRGGAYRNPSAVAGAGDGTRAVR